ncbi:glutathione S-transferase [Sandarakinorhabdus sp. DWP1-3-1]|uniref:glutathione S-transferase n=1 Tax=Sandarakinorhabdus sp. DWP1-3-1 TaxID=2804627 RepID=UPI003CF88AC5
MTADQPLLYSFRRCPYAMRARMALLVAGLPVLVHEILLRDKPAALLAASPKATVPVLVLPDGRVIDESLDIMAWALGQADPEGWLDRRDAAVMATNDGAFKQHLDGYKYADRQGSERAAHRDAALSLLAVAEDRLTLADWLCGDRRGLADIAIMPFVRQFAAVDRGWFAAQPLPRVQAWLAALETSPLFMASMQTYPLGEPTLLAPAA